jgi:hypothetical protein
MNDENLDQTDEDILTPTVSDEALDAAAGNGEGLVFITLHSVPGYATRVSIARAYALGRLIFERATCATAW